MDGTPENAATAMSGTGRKRVLVMLLSPLSGRMAGVARFARERGWHLMFHDRLGLSHPFDWTGDGVIATIRDDKRSLAFLRRLARRGTPIVDLTCDVPRFRCPRVVTDHVAVGRLAAEHFFERNIRHRVFFALDGGAVRDRIWRGFTEKAPALRWCFAAERPRVRWNDWDAVPRWLAAKLAAAPKPLGVLAYAQGEAVRLLDAALSAGLAVPDDVAIVSGADDPVLLENQPVPISAVDTRQESAAYEAAALLQRLMDGAVPPDEPVQFAPLGVVARRSTDSTAASDPLVRSALAVFSSSIASRFDMESVARSLGVNRNTLDRRFVAEFGRTAAAQLRHQRILLARSLLADPANKVAFVARAAGFSSASHLGTALRAGTGLAPAKWRRTGGRAGS